jgi:hypothetical protein
MTKQETGVLACRLLAVCGFFMFLLRIEELSRVDFLKIHHFVEREINAERSNNFS